MVESEIKPWRYPPSVDFLYGDHARHRAIRSKDAAADWALARLPEGQHRAVLARARAIYVG